MNFIPVVLLIGMACLWPLDSVDARSVSPKQSREQLQPKRYETIQVNPPRAAPAASSPRTPAKAADTRATPPVINIVNTRSFPAAAVPATRPGIQSAPLGADFQKAWKLENDAAVVMAEIWQLKAAQREEQIEAMITKIIAELKIEDDAAPATDPFKWSGFSYQGNAQVGSYSNAIYTQAPQSEINAASQKLKPLESQLDVYYDTYLTPKQTANPFAFGKSATAVTPDEKLQWGLLYLTTQFRRAAQGYPLHAQTYGLRNDVDCAGDLVTSQLFLKEGLSMLSNDYPSAVVFNNRIAAQTMCMSAAQLAVSDSSFVDAMEKIFAILDANDRIKLMELVMNPLLLIYDAGKSQYSRIFDLLDDYRSVATEAYADGSRLKKMGVYLVNYKTNQVQEVQFESPKDSELQAVVDNQQSPLQDMKFVKNLTTLYGLDIKDLQKQQCQGLQQLMKQNKLALDSQTGAWMKGPWSGFVGNMSSGPSMGNGITPMLETFAKGLPDTGGICDGGGGAGGAEGGLSCGMSTSPMSMVKAQKCFANPPPFKLPTPGGDYMEGDGISVGGPTIKDMVKSADYNFKGSPACGSFNPYADDAPQELDKDEKERREKLDEKTEDNKKKAQEKIDQEKLDKKLDDAAKANGQQPKGNAAEAKAKADAALKNAKTASDLKATTSGGIKKVTAEVNKSQPVSSSPCAKCPEGTNNLGGNTSVKENKDGKKESTITLDRENAKGAEGVKVALHEWAHAYLSGRGVTGEGAHHDIMGGAGIKYCSPSDDSCSSGCNAQQVNMMGNYTCNETKWGEGLVSAKCSDPKADCKNPNDLASDGVSNYKVAGGGGGSSSSIYSKTGGVGKPSWCFEISLGPDGVLPPECQGDSEGSGGDCNSNKGGGLMAIDIFKVNSNFGRVDPPWDRAAAPAASKPEKSFDSSPNSRIPKR